MKMSISEKFGIAGMILVVAISLAAMYGWVANIIKLIALLDGGVTAWMVARAIGVFAAPLGAVLGFF